MAKGGDNNVLNLVTACNECNNGKSDTLLSDKQALEKTIDELALIQERKNQIEQMVAWRKQLIEDRYAAADPIVKYWEETATRFQLNETGRKAVAQLVSKFGAEEVIESMTAAADRYLRFDPEGKVTEESWLFAYSSISRICEVRRKDRTLPGFSRLYYCKGILRNRFNPTPHQLMRVFLELKEALEAGIQIDEIEEACKTTNSISHLREMVEVIWLGRGS